MSGRLRTPAAVQPSHWHRNWYFPLFSSRSHCVPSDCRRFSIVHMYSAAAISTSRLWTALLNSRLTFPIMWDWLIPLHLPTIPTGVSNFVSFVCFTLICRNFGECRTVPGSIPGGVTGFFSDIFPSDQTMALGSTQPVVKMITRNIPGGIKAAGA